MRRQGLDLVGNDAESVVVSVDGHEVRLGHRWLRDHSEDPESLHPVTGQREVDTFALAPQPHARRVWVDADRLSVEWTDGAPTSVCSAALLRSVFGLDAPPRATGWASPQDLNLANVPNDNVLADDTALLSLLDRVAVDGVALIGGIEPTEHAATVLADRIGRVRRTVFGTMWRVASDVEEHLDSAYATTHLEPHTDATYMTDAPGTQLFCCVERSGTGGESIFVDGFAAAEELRRAAPDAFATLTDVEVPARYLEPGVSLRAQRPPIRLGPDGSVIQVTFNNYDRAPFWLPEPQMSAFYTAYAALHELIVDRERWLEVRLEPGDAVLFDNWRVLHGRQGFTGSRVFHGCYHDRDEIDSRRRVLRAG